MNSLSENSALLWWVTTTGSIQASLLPAAAAATSSVRDTAIAASPLNASDAAVLVAMLAKYRREPLSQLNPPLPSGRGPNTAAGSPLDTMPFSKYLGSVPIGPTWGTHTSSTTAGSGLP